MIQNPNPGLYIFVYVRRGGGGARGGVDKGVNAIVFICDPLYQPNTSCFTFS